jgi:hypothetical protein
LSSSGLVNVLKCRDWRQRLITLLEAIASLAPGANEGLRFDGRRGVVASSFTTPAGGMRLVQNRPRLYAEMEESTGPASDPLALFVFRDAENCMSTLNVTLRR